MIRIHRNHPSIVAWSMSNEFSGQVIWCGFDHGSMQAAPWANNTYWQAATGDTSPWWMLDTEKGLALRHINVCFPHAEQYCYLVEVSIDNKEWTTVMDKQNASAPEQKADIKFKADQQPILARYIRIRFVKESPATVAEVKVSGIVQ